MKHIPLLRCWNCECQVRELDEHGLCDKCMPKKKVKPSDGGTDMIWKITNNQR